jgi:hypothetical protein
MDITIKSNLQIQCHLTKIPSVVYHRNRKSNPKIHMEAQQTQNTQSILKQEEQCWSYTMLDFKLFYRAIVAKTA